MNCEMFQEQIVECGASVGARSKQLRAHLAECSACAAVAREQERLALLMGNLRDSKISDDERPANSATRIEATLLSKFRRQHSPALASLTAESSILAELSTTTNPSRNTEPSASTKLPTLFPSVSSVSSVVKNPPHLPRIPSLRRWGALAAGILLALGIVLRVTQTPSLPPPPRIAYLPSPPQEPGILSAASGSGESPKSAPLSAQKATEDSESHENPLAVESVNFAENTEHSDASPTLEMAPASGAESSAASAVSVSAEGFIALLPPTPGFLDDGPAVMRVRVPWSTIERLRSVRGAPLAVPASGFDATRGFAQADLLVGADGTARAIRFVQ